MSKLLVPTLFAAVLSLGAPISPAGAMPGPGALSEVPESRHNSASTDGDAEWAIWS